MTKAILVLLTCLVPLVGLAAETNEIRILHTPAGIRFGILGDTSAGPAPTLFLSAGKLEETLHRTGDYNLVVGVVDHGILCVSLDAPCHGEAQKPGEPGGLAGWRHRLDRGDNWVPGHLSNLSSVLVLPC